MGAIAFHIVLFGISSVMQTFIGLPSVNKQFAIETRILRILPFQSKMISGQAQKQGATGNVIGGNVIGQFPEGIVVLKASSNLNEKDYIHLIKEKISSYPCSCSDFIDMIPVERIHTILNPGIMKPNIFQVHDSIRTWCEAALGEYWLNLSFETDQDEVFLKFLGEAIYYDSLEVNDRGRILREELVNQTIKMNLDLVYFVGFAPPKVKNAYRGSAY